MKLLSSWNPRKLSLNDFRIYNLLNSPGSWTQNIIIASSANPRIMNKAATIVFILAKFESSKLYVGTLSPKFDELI
jgi:hypothetical protein